MIKYFLNFVDSLKIISYMLKYFFEILKFFLRNPQFLTTLQNLKIIFHALIKNFSYTQLFFVFLCILILMILTLFFFFLFRKIFISVLDLFFVFFLFLLQKDFATFHVLLFEAFLCFFW